MRQWQSLQINSSSQKIVNLTHNYSYGSAFMFFISIDSEAFAYIQKWSFKTYLKIGVLKNFTNFRGKHLCCNLFLIKLQVFTPANVSKRGSNTAFFPMKFVKVFFDRTPSVADSLPSDYLIIFIVFALRIHANNAYKTNKMKIKPRFKLKVCNQFKKQGISFQMSLG